jgi:hypothetical protein
MTMTRTSTSRNPRRTAWLTLLLLSFVWSGTRTANADDFGNIVHHIEARYHVHRNHRFILGFASLVVKFWHIAGVKNMKVALFENQSISGSASDVELDQIVQAAGSSGWQPVVRHIERDSGEHTYVYARYVGSDLKLLVVNVESSEAVVAQVKVNPDKLVQFLDETNPGVLSARNRKKHDAPDNPEERTLLADDVSEMHFEHGRCMFCPARVGALP